ncbi:MAG TPA: zinc-binding dehydrogenase [Jatrophihabitans sp.]|nr:zinc-binding dehydrogenase [Jatrophihabitans sp.]
MRAVVARRFGDPDVLEMAEIPLPQPAEDEVLVRVAFAGAGDWDLAYRRGERGGTVPYVPGAEFSGTVVGDTGDAASFQDGEPVYGHCGLTGAYAEYVRCPAEALAPLPAAMSLADAAAAPYPVLAAIDGLSEILQVQRLDRVLVTAGASGLGHVAVQFARLLGAEVVATARTRDHEFVHRCGAVEVVDHDDPEWPERVAELPRGLPLKVLVCSNETIAAAARACAAGGMIATPVGASHPEGGDVKWRPYDVRPSGSELIRMGPRFDDGSLAVQVEKRFDWRDAADAHRYLEEQPTRGTLVLEIADA